MRDYLGKMITAIFCGLGIWKTEQITAVANYEEASNKTSILLLSAELCYANENHVKCCYFTWKRTCVREAKSYALILAKLF